MAVIPFKRGDTFMLTCTVTNNNAPVDITGWGIRAHIRTGATLVASLDHEPVTPSGGVYKLRKNHDDSVAPTSGWPVKLLDVDIEYTLPGSAQVVSTDTFQVQVIADVTRD